MRQDLAQNIEELARQLPKRTSVKKELKKLPLLVADDERVVRLDTGTHAGDDGLVVATDRRLMFLLVGLTRSRVEEFPFDEIAAVKPEVENGTSRLAISTYDDRAEISNMSEPMAAEITDFARSRSAATGVAEETPAAYEVPLIEPEAEGINVVLIGVFEPWVLQPKWFAAQDLFTQAEASGTNVQENADDRVAFTTDVFDVIAKRGHLLIGTTRPRSLLRLKEVVSGMLALLQPNITRLGINRGTHFRLPSVEAWREIAQRLAPCQDWGLLPDVTMRKLTVQGSRLDGRAGSVIVQVEPSVQFGPGVYIQVNDQFEVANRPSAEGCTAAERIVTESWGRSMTQAEAICRHVLFGTV